MPLRDLKRAPELDYANEPDPFEDPRVLADSKFEALQPRLTPVHPHWVPTVFFDPIRFPNEIARERILRFYSCAMPGREVRLQALAAVEMSRSIITKYPQSEEIFRRRGFVADIDVTAFHRKDHHAATRFLTRHKAAVCLQLAVIDDLLYRRGAARDWASWREAQLLALHGGSRRLPSPLVERDGVFLPAQMLRPREKIHLAHTWEVDHALAHGHRDVESLVAAMPDELLEQFRFERHNSRRFFGARPAALLLWQTQALAALRKTAWQVELTTGTALNKQEANESKAQTRALRTVRKALQQWEADGEALRQGINGIKIPKTAYAATVGDLVDVYAEELQAVNKTWKGTPYGPGLGSAEYMHSLSTELILVAALHGATYCPRFDSDDPCDRNDPIHWLQPMALWISEMKRQRTASLGENIATSILAILAEVSGPDLDDPELGSYARLIFDRLGDEAWAVLGVAAEQLLARDKFEPLVVVYDWTRDPDRSWRAEQRADGTVVIEGPLLDFPRSQAAMWNDKAAAIVRAEKGLFCKRPH